MKLQKVLMPIVRGMACWVAVVAVLPCLTMVTTSAQAITINRSGDLEDLDGDGSNLDEMGVLNTAIDLWSSQILTDRTFNLTVESADLGDAVVSGDLNGFDAQNVPNSGELIVNNNPFMPWFVDDTPAEDSEFTPHFDFDNNHRHLVTRPDSAQLNDKIDLLTVITHGIGHALGWNAEPLDFPDFNPRYVALMDPQPANFSEGTRVFLRSGAFNVPLAGNGLGSFEERVDELSHTANSGEVPGWNNTLMFSNSPLIIEGRATRYLPGNADVEMFAYAYGDAVAVPEPPLTLLSSGLVTVFGLLLKSRKRLFKKA